MFRNHFQNILWNLHISDPDDTNPRKGEANHDPLILVRPMGGHDAKKFLYNVQARKGTSFGWKHMSLLRTGSISSVITQKNQNRFHIKLFMVSEPSTGYICGFEVFTGDASGQSQGNATGITGGIKNFLHCPMFVRFSTVVGHGSSCLFWIIITIALTWLICCTRGKHMHVTQSGTIESHFL